jgi:hypothetical protein
MNYLQQHPLALTCNLSPNLLPSHQTISWKSLNGRTFSSKYAHECIYIYYQGENPLRCTTHDEKCHNPSLGFMNKARAYKGVAKSEPDNHISCSRECKRVWGNEPPHSQVSSNFGSWSPHGLLNLQRAIIRVKIHWIEELFISLKSFWNLDV